MVDFFITTIMTRHWCVSRPECLLDCESIAFTKSCFVFTVCNNYSDLPAPEKYPNIIIKNERTKHL